MPQMETSMKNKEAVWWAVGLMAGGFVLGFALLIGRDTCLNKSYAQYMGPEVCQTSEEK